MFKDLVDSDEQSGLSAGTTFTPPFNAQVPRSAIPMFVPLALLYIFLVTMTISWHRLIYMSYFWEVLPFTKTTADFESILTLTLRSIKEKFESSLH